MEVLLILGATWMLLNAMVVSLCVMAKRGDQVQPVAAPRPMTPVYAQADPGFVATIATPGASPKRPVAPQRSRVHH